MDTETKSLSSWSVSATRRQRRCRYTIFSYCLYAFFRMNSLNDVLVTPYGAAVTLQGGTELPSASKISRQPPVPRRTTATWSKRLRVITRCSPSTIPFPV